MKWHSGLTSVLSAYAACLTRTIPAWVKCMTLRYEVTQNRRVHCRLSGWWNIRFKWVYYDMGFFNQLLSRSGRPPAYLLPQRGMTPSGLMAVGADAKAWRTFERALRPTLPIATIYCPSSCVSSRTTSRMVFIEGLKMSSHSTCKKIII